MAKRKGSNSGKLVGTSGLPAPIEYKLRKESRWSNRKSHEPGTVPAGMRFAFGPEHETAYGECRGVEPPIKRFKGMKRSAYDGR